MPGAWAVCAPCLVVKVYLGLVKAEALFHHSITTCKFCTSFHRHFSEGKKESNWELSCGLWGIALTTRMSISFSLWIGKMRVEPVNTVPHFVWVLAGKTGYKHTTSSASRFLWGISCPSHSTPEIEYLTPSHKTSKTISKMYMRMT